MTLELTAAEREVLVEVLKERLGELREQVVHATTPAFKDGLREREAVLQGLIARCEAAQ